MKKVKLMLTAGFLSVAIVGAFASTRVLTTYFYYPDNDQSEELQQVDSEVACPEFNGVCKIAIPGETQLIQLYNIDPSDGQLKPVAPETTK
jgi:hypothetical protein